MLTIDWGVSLERCTLLATLVLMWIWLARPARARSVARLRARHLTLACSGAVLLNLLLVAAIPHVATLSGAAGALLPALLRELATLIIAAPLTIVGLGWARGITSPACPASSPNAAASAPGAADSPAPGPPTPRTSSPADRWR